MNFEKCKIKIIDIEENTSQDRRIEMGVKCPKHNVDLEIEYTSINMMGNKYHVVTGQCHKCKIKYLSREIMSSSGSFKIGGQVYEYLNDMEIAHPYPFKPITQLREEHTPPKDSGDPVPPVGITKEAERPTEPAKVRTVKNENNRKSSSRKKHAAEKVMTVQARKLLYLKTIPKFCLTDSQALTYADHILVSVGNSSVETKGWRCPKCKTVYVSDEIQELTKEKIRQADIKRFPENIKFLQMGMQRSAPNEPINLAIPQNTLYICKGTIVCKRNGHLVESVTGVMLDKNGSTVKVNANYCPQCQKYFISYDEYIYYRKKYGILLGNLKITNSSFEQTQANLADESILHMCGYSVNQTADLTVTNRHRILQFLLDSGISTKPEIINYLNFFVRRNGKRQNMEEAVRRWNEDLKWVREYQIDKQRQFEITNIQKNR